MFYENEKWCIEHYGDITKAVITNYWKYQFTIFIETDKNLKLQLVVGGDSDDIYRYDPLSLDWSEHIYAKIESCDLLAEIKISDIV